MLIHDSTRGTIARGNKLIANRWLLSLTSCRKLYSPLSKLNRNNLESSWSMISFPLRANPASLRLHLTKHALMQKKCQSQMIWNRFRHLACSSDAVFIANPSKESAATVDIYRI